MDGTRGEDGRRKTGYTGHVLESGGEAQKRQTAKDLAGRYPMHGYDIGRGDELAEDRDG